VVDETTPTLAALTSVAPRRLRSAFSATVGHLLGGAVSWPSAWLKRKERCFDEDKTAMSADIHYDIAALKISDPRFIDFAASALISNQLRETRNLAQIAQRAAEHLSEDKDDASDDEQDVQHETSGEPDEDWINTFARFARDASSERLQDLFARVLAGEISRPGAYSPTTLRAVSEMDKETAEDFSIAWSKSVGDAVHYSSFWKRGDGYSLWGRLAEAGLMAPRDTAQFLPNFAPLPTLGGVSLWSPIASAATPLALLIAFSRDCAARWVHIDFTRTGRQIGSLIAPPPFEDNIREAAADLSGAAGIQWIELIRVGGKNEVIFRRS